MITNKAIKEAKRVLKLIDKTWDIVLKQNLGKIVPVYSLNESKRAKCYNQVIALVSKDVNGLRQYGASFCTNAVGKKMAWDCLTAPDKLEYKEK